MPIVCMFNMPRKIPIHVYWLLISIIVFSILKYMCPIVLGTGIVWRALFIDYKWIYYMLISIIWIQCYGSIRIEYFYRIGRCFAIYYIIYIIVHSIFQHGYTRSSGYMFDECNYVIYMALIPYCFKSGGKKLTRDDWIFIIASVLSWSKTGVVSGVVLALYKRYEAFRFKWLIWMCVPLIGMLYFWLYFYRNGVVSIGDIDRVIFFAQFWEYIKHASIWELLLGTNPTVPMKIPLIPAFAWYIQEFESINHISGAFPFYFHSTYIRLFLVWGIPLTLTLLLWIRRLYLKCDYEPLKKLIVLFVLESLSLSTLSLVNVSIVFYLAFFTAYINYRHKFR